MFIHLISKGKEGKDIIKLDNKILVKKVKTGDLESLMHWVMERKDKFYKIAWSYVYNHQDIEDIFQNTMIKVHEKINTLKDIELFETWFISILINECRQCLKSRKKELLHEDMGIYYYHVDEYNFFQEINSIDEIFRESVVLKYVVGYSQEEISQILDIPIGTVKSRIYRGLRELRSLLKEV